MKRTLLLTLLISTLAGCSRNHQTGYFHSPDMLTEADRKAVLRVQGLALGKPEIRRSIIAEYLNADPTEVTPCKYKVSKVIRRDLAKTDGVYPEEMHVICMVTAEDSLFRFEWVIDQNQFLSDFKFGYADHQPLDD
jgi:hypothetical protein